MRIKMSSRVTIMAALVAAAAGAGEALAQTSRAAPAHAPAQPSDPYYAPKKPPLNPDEETDALYHDSGTIGRDSLGAEPGRPEGPGGTTGDVN